jgi:ferritin-like metal-binding protein YciE
MMPEGGEVPDAGMIAAQQAVEHDEITRDSAFRSRTFPEKLSSWA